MAGAIGLLYKAMTASSHVETDEAFALSTLRDAANGILWDVLHTSGTNPWLDNDGVLVEQCDEDDDCDYDKQQFKGIFVRFLNRRILSGNKLKVIEPII
jgi:hypothetical protein